MVRAYVGLGANLGDPPAQLRAALEWMARDPAIGLVARSSFYRSAPLGPAGQSDYCNAVCAVDTELAPETLLDRLHAIESGLGRDRSGPRWGPRALDLDLLLYGDCRIDTPRLHLPHPEMARRNFVLAPLAEIAPDVEVPGHGRAAELARRIGREGLALWEGGTPLL